MNIIKKITFLALGSVLITSCSQQQARRPISQTSSEFMKQSVLRNKKLIKGEEGKIDSIIKRNPNIQYVASKKGYWKTTPALPTRRCTHGRASRRACPMPMAPPT